MLFAIAIPGSHHDALFDSELSQKRRGKARKKKLKRCRNLEIFIKGSFCTLCREYSENVPRP